MRQATEGSAAHSRDVTNNDSFHSKSVQNPNSSVEGIKAGYSKYDYKSNGKTGNSFSSAGGSDSLSKAPTYNLIGSRILKKLKSGVGPTVTPDQILKAGVVENKYLYNAILNSQKSRPKLANPFKADN